MRQNSRWQNKMNLFSGVTVLLGLIGTMFGFIFMDEFAAIVVGSVLIAMGVKLIIEARGELSTTAKQLFKPIVFGSIFGINNLSSYFSIDSVIKANYVRCCKTAKSSHIYIVCLGLFEFNA